MGEGAEALRLLGPPVAGGEVWAELWYCPECRATCALRLGGAEAHLRGGSAVEIIGRAVPLDEGDS